MEDPARVDNPNFKICEGLSNLGVHEVFYQPKEPIFGGLDANHDGIESFFHDGFVHIFYSNVALQKVGLNNISEGLHVI